MKTKRCLVCQQLFQAKHKDAQCCSNKCRSRLSRGSMGRIPTLDDLIRAEERRFLKELWEDD